MSEEVTRGEIKEFIQEMKTEIGNAGRAFICLNEEYLKLVNDRKDVQRQLVWMQRQIEAAKICFGEENNLGAMMYMSKLDEKLKELILR